MAHIQITPVSGAVSVSAAGMPLGTTTAALALTEGASRPVIYVPRADMAMDKLIRTDRVTLCPHKGTCSYYSVVTPKGVMENVVWSYESPLAGAEKIAGHLAFYPAITLEQQQPS